MREMRGRVRKRETKRGRCEQRRKRSIHIAVFNDQCCQLSGRKDEREKEKTRVRKSHLCVLKLPLTLVEMLFSFVYLAVCFFFNFLSPSHTDKLIHSRSIFFVYLCMVVLLAYLMKCDKKSFWMMIILL